MLNKIKVEKNNKDISPKGNIKIIKSQTSKSISLSSLSKSNNNKFNKKLIPEKEASEESKSSLKNLLTKINKENREFFSSKAKKEKVLSFQSTKTSPIVEEIKKEEKDNEKIITILETKKN